MKNFLFLVLLGSMMVPLYTIFIPLFVLVIRLGLVNSYAGVIIPGVAGAFGIFFMKQSMEAVPNELLDSARIDGATEFRIYWQIALPLVRPALAVLAVLAFMTSWNDFVWPLVVLRSRELQTLPVVMAGMRNMYRNEHGVVMAASLLSTMPISAALPRLAAAVPRRADGGRGQVVTQMQAAILTEPNTPFRVETVTLDPPKAGEVLVKIAASGICRSDWRVAIGTAPKPMPIITGHEGAGIVEAVGPGVTSVQTGDHVTLTWAPICGDCFYCRRGKANLCAAYRPAIASGLLDDGTARIHWQGEPVYILAGLGSFAEYAVVREASCVPIRRDVGARCRRPGRLRGRHRRRRGHAYTAGVSAGESVAVFGAGGIGLNIIHGAQLCGAHPIIAVDASEAKTALARQFGATHALPSDETTVDRIQALCGGRGVDRAFEAVGIPELQERAFAATRPGGTLTLVGTAPDGSSTNLPGAVITRTEKTVRGCSYGSVNPQRDIPLLLDLYRAGKLKLEQMITRRYRLDQINEAYADLLSGELARGIIVF